jgi:hypothetical protein
LIDFGLSCYYLERKENGEVFHKPKVELYAFSGNFIFASVNSLKGYSKSRRDDLKSAFYMIIFLLNNNTLPWLTLCSGHYSFQEKVYHRLSSQMMLKFFQLLQDQRLVNIFNYIHNLGFE